MHLSLWLEPVGFNRLADFIFLRLWGHFDLKSLPDIVSADG
jgi:hypothetical protein